MAHKSTDWMTGLPQIVLDTQVLRGMNLRHPSAEFRLLENLASDNLLHWHISDVSVRELVSFADNDIQGKINQITSAYERLRKDKWFCRAYPDSKMSSSVASAIEEIKRGGAVFAATARKFLSDAHIRVIETPPDSAREVLDHYFDGQVPFRNPKSREDFPDAFILKGATSLSETLGPRLFVTADDRLGQGAAKAGFVVVKSLAGALEHAHIRTLFNDGDFAVWWSENWEGVIRQLREKREAVLERIDESVDYFVVETEVESPEIPSDDHSARAQFAGYPEGITVEWDEPAVNREGLVSFKCSFRALCWLNFSVYRGDISAVPAWADVDIADIAESHYLDANGEREIEFRCNVVFEFDRSVMDEPVDLDELAIDITDIDAAFILPG